MQTTKENIFLIIYKLNPFGSVRMWIRRNSKKLCITLMALGSITAKPL